MASSRQVAKPKTAAEEKARVFKPQRQSETSTSNGMLLMFPDRRLLRQSLLQRRRLCMVVHSWELLQRVVLGRLRSRFQQKRRRPEPSYLRDLYIRWGFLFASCTEAGCAQLVLGFGIRGPRQHPARKRPRFGSVSFSVWQPRKGQISNRFWANALSMCSAPFLSLRRSAPAVVWVDDCGRSDVSAASNSQGPFAFT